MLKLTFLMQYILNKWMNFDQTYTQTLLGGDLELIRFWRPWPNFQGHQPMKKVEISFSDVISSEQMHGFRPKLHKKNTVGRRPRVD